MCISSGQTTLAGSCCTTLEMIPPFFALCSSIAAIASTIIMRQNFGMLRQRYIIALHGSGALSSAYLFSLAPRIATSKSLTSHTNELKKTNQQLSTQVNRLEGSVTKSEKNNEELRSTLTSFQEERIRLNESIAQLSDALCINIPLREQQDEARLNNLQSEVGHIIKTVLEEGQQVTLQQNQTTALALRKEVKFLEEQLKSLKKTEEGLNKILEGMNSHFSSKPNLEQIS